MIWFFITFCLIWSAYLFKQRRDLQIARHNVKMLCKAEAEAVDRLVDARLGAMELQVKLDDMEILVQTLQEQYEALDQGAIEVQEGYEQEYLTKNEIIEEQAKMIQYSAPVREHHFANCLPDVNDMKFFQDYSAEFWESTPVYDSLIFDLIG